MIRTILALFGFLLQLFRRAGVRVRIETRSEASIDTERKRLEKLRADVEKKKEVLDVVTHQIAFYKANGNDVAANGLDESRRMRIKQFNDAKSQYERAGGRWP